jgi:uncharacterized protein with FMN-binding domain
MIPKRAISAAVTTLFALVLLLSFKTPASPALAAPSAADAAIVGTGTPTPTSTSTTGTAATNPTPAATSTTTLGTYVDGTVTGPVVSNRFGDVQVQVTISGGVVTDVTALQLPSGDRRTNDISARVEPTLRSEALSAQDANIDLVSGATFTSVSYRDSLQAALDQAVA